MRPDGPPAVDQPDVALFDAVPAAHRNSGESLLRLSGVTKQFGEQLAVHSINVEIQRGEFFTLLGPSGCGKTTLLRIISGFERLTDGRVELRDVDVTDAPPERRPFNMVFQSYALFPHMSVAENIGYGLRVSGAPRSAIEQRVLPMLELVHLTDAGERSVQELSGGQQQRVALARALIKEPEVLLLDEPLGALDLKLRKRLQDELKAIQGRLGTTFVYVTHDQEEAVYLSHRIGVMQDGELAQVGTPREIYNQPATRFVAEFVGDANLIECEVIEATTSSVVVRLSSGGVVELPQSTGDQPTTGDKVVAVLRPEQLELTDTPDAPVVGELIQTVFMGSNSRHDLRLADDTVLRVATSVDTNPPSGARLGVRIREGEGAVVPAPDVAQHAASGSDEDNERQRS